MAASKLTIEFEWENGVMFGMLSADGEEDSVQIVELHENACIECIWSHAQSLCLAYVADRLTQIGNEMKME